MHVKQAWSTSAEPTTQIGAPQAQRTSLELSQCFLESCGDFRALIAGIVCQEFCNVFLKLNRYKRHAYLDVVPDGNGRHYDDKNFRPQKLSEGTNRWAPQSDVGILEVSWNH